MVQNVPTLSKTLKRVYNLLLVSVVGIASFSIALLVYHFFLVKYVRWRRQNNVMPPHTLTVLSTNGVEQFVRIDQKLLDTIPIIIYSNKNRHAFSLDQTECAVCMGELEEVNKVRVLPGCKHVFHVSCIDMWLKGHVSCPLCRSPLGELAAVIDFPVEVIGGEDDVAGEDTDFALRTRISMIRHCALMVLRGERMEKWFLERNLKRSVSMDQFMVTYAEKSSSGLV